MIKLIVRTELETRISEAKQANRFFLAYELEQLLDLLNLETER